MRRRLQIASAVLALSLASSAYSAEDGEPAASLTFDRVTHDFGTVGQGDRVAAEFSFTNRGEVLLTLSKPTVGCHCQAEIVGTRDVAPGSSGSVRVSCDTSQSAGAQVYTATLHSTEIGRSSVMLTVHGVVRLEVVAEPSQVYLGLVRRGSKHRGVFKLRYGQRSRDRRGPKAVTNGPHLVLTPSPAGKVDLQVAASAPLGPFTQEITVATDNLTVPEIVVSVGGVVVDELPATRW